MQDGEIVRGAKFVTRPEIRLRASRSFSRFTFHVLKALMFSTIYTNVSTGRWLCRVDCACAGGDGICQPVLAVGRAIFVRPAQSI
jgi:hypothetical protein